MGRAPNMMVPDTVNLDDYEVCSRVPDAEKS